jgi:hypothetical protein
LEHLQVGKGGLPPPVRYTFLPAVVAQ